MGEPEEMNDLVHNRHVGVAACRTEVAGGVAVRARPAGFNCCYWVNRGEAAHQIRWVSGVSAGAWMTIDFDQSEVDLARLQDVEIDQLLLDDVRV